MDPKNTPLQPLLDLIRSTDATSFESETDRKTLIAETQALLARLQTPREKSDKLLHTDAYLIAAVKVLLDMGLFEKWEASGGKPLNLQDLAGLSGSDPILLERLLRLVVASGLIQTSPESDGKYIFSEFPRALVTEGLHHAWSMHTFTTSQSVKGLPLFLAATGYINPTDASKSSWVFNTGKTFIEYLKTTPGLFGHINVLMQLKDQGKVPWFEVYPVQQLVEKAAKEGEGETVLVDVGGGVGSDLRKLENFLRKEVGGEGEGGLKKGQLVLQDLKEPIEQAGDLGGVIVKEVHDFFTEQKRKGAAAYYLHTVLHDWPDDDCIKILTQLKAAMKSGHSKLLINELVMGPDSTAAACAADLSMMTVNCGMERSEQQWRSLLDAAGFKIMKVWTSPAIDEALIEAVPA